jgi:hypothetical protein
MRRSQGNRVSERKRYDEEKESYHQGVKATPTITVPQRRPRYEVRSHSTPAPWSLLVTPMSGVMIGADDYASAGRRSTGIQGRARLRHGDLGACSVSLVTSSLDE